MQHDYYKEYYELERQHWWFVAREEIISNYIATLIAKGELPQNPKILNVGCSTGRSSEYLSRFGKVTSIEYDSFCCAFAAEKTGLEIIHGSVTDLPFEDGGFDLVCAFDVIEHVEDDQLAVDEMKRVAKSNGILFLTVPAFMSLWSHHDVINHHFRRYDKCQLLDLFHKGTAGTWIYSGYFNFWLFLPIYFFRRISNLLKLGNKRTGSGSDFESFNPGIINKLLYFVMRSESFFVNKNVSLPFGVSIIAVWKNDANGQAI